MKNILITGGLGFIGFNAIRLWKTTRPEYNYMIVDCETYAAQFMIDEKKKWLENNNVELVNCDICDESQIRYFVKEFNIDTIVNFAAESHVDNSISGPDIFFKTNILGTVSLLNVARDNNLRFHQIGTDEVYGETHPDDWFYDSSCCSERIEAEKKPLFPSSPYSSSKASSDMIALSYHHTFGTNVTVSRCTNNFGPYQHCEKLIGTVIQMALNDDGIPVYGNGDQKRHWIYVDEHNSALMDILEKGEIGKIYNIAPPKDNWISNLELIRFILKYLHKPESLITHVTDRLGHDTSYFLYGTDFCAKTRNWKCDMKKTIDWYKSIMNIIP